LPIKRAWQLDEKSNTSSACATFEETNLHYYENIKQKTATFYESRTH